MKKKVKRDADLILDTNPALATIGNRLSKKKPAPTQGIYNSLEKISRSSKRRYDVLDDIVSLFPDMELAIQILVSSIMSPKDMMSQELYYSLTNLNLPPSVSSALLNELSSTVENVYDINQQLPEIIRNVLFTKGSHVVAVIPESSLDRIMNNIQVTTEDISSGKGMISTNKGILNTSHKTDIDLGFEVTDNLDYLKLSSLEDRALSVTVESAIAGSNTKVKNISNLFSAVMCSVPEHNTRHRESIGRPMVVSLPPEAVIPVQAPGRLDKKYGIFVLLDGNGNPITRDSVKDPDKVILSSFKSTKLDGEIAGSAIIKKAKMALSLKEGDNNIVKEVVDYYQDMVEFNLQKKLETGLYSGKELSIGDVSEVYRILLARTLKEKKTRILYIPSEFMVYYAFKYYPNGVGKSLTDDLMVISSIRAMVLFAKLMAMVKNTIPATKVSVTLDEDDPDPDKTIDTIMALVMNMQQTYLPIGTTNVADITDWATHLGYQFEFTGHPRIPTTSIDYQSAKINHDVPDDELDENLRKRSFMAFGLSPEIVDNGFAGDFATTVVQNNILLSKRVSMYQKVFNRYLTEHISKLIRYDSALRKDLAEIIRNNLPEIYKKLNIKKSSISEKELITTILEAVAISLKVTLPSPESTTLNNLSERYKEYKDALEDAIEAVLKEEILDPDIAGEIGEKLPAVLEVYKAYFLRKWMSDNNYMPELFDMVNNSQEGKPILDIGEITSEHSERLAKSIMTYIKKLNKTKKKMDAAMDRLGKDEDEDTGNDTGPADAGDTNEAEEDTGDTDEEE